jgi:hypothetical protein
MTLKPTEYVVAAWAEPASGPGWANSPLWVLVSEQGIPIYRVECLQPEEQTDEMQTLYAVSRAAHVAMTAAVRRLVQKW